MPEGDAPNAAVTPTPAAPAPPQAAPPTLTQEEVNRLVGSARVEARNALLKKLGVESEDALKTAIEERDALKQSQMTEVEQAQAKAEAAEVRAKAAEALVDEAKLSLLRAKVGRDKGLPEPLIEKLQGTDEDAIAAEVDALLPFLKGGAVAPDLGGGTIPPGAGNGLSPDEQMAQGLVAALAHKVRRI